MFMSDIIKESKKSKLNGYTVWELTKTVRIIKYRPKKSDSDQQIIIFYNYRGVALFCRAVDIHPYTCYMMLPNRVHIIVDGEYISCKTFRRYNIAAKSNGWIN